MRAAPVFPNGDTMEPDELQTAIAKAAYVVRSLLAEMASSREKSIAVTKLDELEMWVGRGLNHTVRYERMTE